MPQKYTPGLLYKSISKVCIICGETFYRPKGKSDTVWEKQKCCGKNCSNYARRKVDACRKSIIRRQDTPKGGRSICKFIS